MSEGRGLPHEVKAVSPSEKAQPFLTLWRAAVGPREAAAPTRRAAAARLALIMAARWWKYEAANALGKPRAARSGGGNASGNLQPRGVGGRGLVAAAWRTTLPRRRRPRCLTRDYLTATPRVRPYG